MLLRRCEYGKAQSSLDFCAASSDRDTVDDVRAMVLAAGLGTRLRPLTLERPKPAVPLAGRPLASFALGHLSRFGVRHAVINTHHLGAKLPEFLDPHRPIGMELTYVHEPVLLGTGGGIRNAAPHLLEGNAPVLVMNGDILFAPDLAGALDLHLRLGAVATMVLREDPNAARFGGVEITEEGRVRRLLGRPEAVDEPLRTLMFTGVHVLSPEAFRDLPAEGCIVRHAYRTWVDEGAVVGGFVDGSPFRDLGTLAAYLETNLDLARGAIAWPDVSGNTQGAIVNPMATIGAGASIEESVIDAGVTVAPGARIARTVAWPGARLEGIVCDAVVTGERVVSIADAE